MQVAEIGEVYKVFKLEKTVDSFLECERILKDNNYKPIRSIRYYFNEGYVQFKDVFTKKFFGDLRLGDYLLYNSNELKIVVKEAFREQYFEI